MKCCDITAGMLRHSVFIQRLHKIPDGAGGWIKEWVSIGSSFAFVRAQNGNERFGADRLNAEVRYKAVIRWRNDISTADRIIFEEKAYQIRSIIDVEFRKKFLDLDLESGVAV